MVDLLEQKMWELGEQGWKGYGRPVGEKVQELGEQGWEGYGRWEKKEGTGRIGMGGIWQVGENVWELGEQGWEGYGRREKKVLELGTHTRTQAVEFKQNSGVQQFS